MPFGGFFNNLLMVSGLILIGGLLAFVIVIRLLRMWARRMEQRERRGGDFDMAELFELHQQGKLSGEEYERAKQAVLSRSGRWTSVQTDAEGKRGFAVIPTGEPGTPPPPAG